MTCGGCKSKVKTALLSLPEVTSVEVSKATNSATITMSKHITLPDFQNALRGISSKYWISAIAHIETVEMAKSWLLTYKPLLLITAFIMGVALITSSNGVSINTMKWMNSFMAGFFIVFSFFKLLNLKGFAESYSMYDIVAKKIKVYGYLYPFIELLLGLAYFIHFHPLLVNIITIVIMGISSIGVIKSVMDRKAIKCACLGDVFNLPMSTVTIIEDLTMVGMAMAMLFFIN